MLHIAGCQRLVIDAYKHVQLKLSASTGEGVTGPRVLVSLLRGTSPVQAMVREGDTISRFL